MHPHTLKKQKKKNKNQQILRRKENWNEVFIQMNNSIIIHDQTNWNPMLLGETPWKNETKKSCYMSNELFWKLSLKNNFKDFKWNKLWCTHSQVSLNSHPSVFEFIPQCLWFHTQFSNIALHHPSRYLKTGIQSKCSNVLWFKMQPNSAYEEPKFWKPSLSLSLSSSRREKKLKAPLNPTPKSPWLRKWCLWSDVHIASFIP